MRRLTFVLLLSFAASCATTGLSLKQTGLTSLQVSETSLAGAQTIENALCFNDPSLESGPACTNPIAATVGLTSLVANPDYVAGQTPAQIPRHQLIAKYFVKAFTAELAAENALLAWKAGDPAPTTVSDYQADINAALTVANQLAPGLVSAPLLAKLQAAVTGAAAVATAVGVK